MPLTKVNTAMVSSGGGDIATNAALGSQALNSNTSGANNTAVGNQALYSNTTGEQSVAVGAFALDSQTTGAYNTTVGYDSMSSLTTGQVNTCLGYGAGSALTTSSSNTLIGAAAGQAITTGAKNTVIGRYNGNQGGLDIRTASNYIVLSDGDGNPRVMVNPTGYTKISNNAGWEQTNTFHNIVQTAADTTLIVTNTNANPFGLVLKHANAAPNANSNAFLTCEDNSGGGRVVVRIWSNGNMQNLNNSYGSLSDQAIKENIVDATPKLADLMNVKVRNFNLIGEETKQIGVVAQELETVFPSMVESTEDGFKGVKYSVFVPMLIKAVQELNAKVEAQAAEIAALKAAP